MSRNKTSAKVVLEGNALLESVFAGQEREIDDQFLPFEPREPVANLRKFKTSDIGLLPAALENTNASPGVTEVIAQQNGLHAIAWYLPYRFHGESGWGIYFDTFAMTRFSIEVASLARLLDPSVTNSQTRKVVYAAVLRHELEHAIQELLLAKAIQAKTIAIADVASKSFSKTYSYRETIASHFENLDALVGLAKIPTQTINIIRRVLQTLPLPPVYDAWKSSSIEMLDSKYELELGLHPLNPLGEPSYLERGLFKGRAKSAYIDIPIYAWQGNGLKLKLNGLDLRAQSLDCKKLLRLIRKGGLASHFGVEIEVQKSSDHDVKIGNPYSRPIKFGCHDWDSVPNDVVGQLAAATGVSRSEFVDRIRKLV
jgi:hypothetical protein